MKKALFFVSLLLLTACNKRIPKPEPKPVEAQTAEMPEVNDGFEKFLNQFPEVSLPIEINACGVESDLVELDPVISQPFHEGGYVYGKFALGTNRIAVITLSAADCFLPILTTYSLTGRKIDSKQITIGGCDDGPCYKCTDISEIHKDLTIYFADTMQAFECDEYDLPKGKPVSTTIAYKEGKINKDGSIELSEEKEKKL